MSALRTSTTINAAFLREIKDDHDAWRSVVAEARAVLTGQHGVNVKPAELVELFQKLRNELTVHFALEETFGYVDDATDVPEGVARRVMALRRQHDELLMDATYLDDTACSLADGKAVDETVKDLIFRFDRFHRRLAQHDHQEDDLIVLQLRAAVAAG